LYQAWKYCSSYGKFVKRAHWLFQFRITTDRYGRILTAKSNKGRRTTDSTDSSTDFCFDMQDVYTKGREKAGGVAAENRFAVFSLGVCAERKLREKTGGVAGAVPPQRG
jgi:hypothetical protein